MFSTGKDSTVFLIQREPIAKIRVAIGLLEVVEIIYMGDILRAVLKVAGSDEFVMKMRNTLGQTKLSPGQKIKVGWHPQDARALDP